MILDEEEFERWLRSAKLTLRSALRDSEAGDHNWACFKAHQAAEKALKALLWGIGEPAYGHSLKALAERVREVGLEAPSWLIRAATRLSGYYTPTRYPDVWSEGIPEEYYTEEEAGEAIALARRIVEWVEEVWRRLSRGGRG